VEDTRINDPERNWDENRSRRWEFREERGCGFRYFSIHDPTGTEFCPYNSRHAHTYTLDPLVPHATPRLV
jgi:hypothetical protein